MTIDLKDFWIGKEVFWISFEDGSITIKSGKISELNARDSRIDWKRPSKWFCRANIDYCYRDLDNLFHTRQAALEELIEQVGDL